MGTGMCVREKERNLIQTAFWDWGDVAAAGGAQTWKCFT